MPNDSTPILGSVSIIIPVKNGLPYFEEVCAALKEQDYQWPVEVICIDSGSTDGSIEVAKKHGFRVEHISSKDFGHGKTRNWGASLSNSEFVAFLTHDAVPANKDWLFNLIKPMFSDIEVVGVFSRHEAHIGADPFIAWELREHFKGLADFPVVQITNRDEYDSNIGLQQVYHFYSDNASAMRKSIWNQHPYPDVQFAEDQIWAKEVVEAGHKKAYAQESVVRHSHSFGPWETLRRSFDESRALRKLFGYKLGTSFGGIFKSTIYLLKRDMKNAFANGWWRTHPIKTLSRVLESFMRPAGHYLGARESIPQSIEKRISRDDWIRNL